MRGDTMIFYEDDNLLIRSMIEMDIERLVNGFIEQNWNKPYKLFKDYYNQ